MQVRSLLQEETRDDINVEDSVLGKEGEVAIEKAMK